MALMKSARRMVRPVFPFGEFSALPTLEDLEHRMRKAFEAGPLGSLESALATQPIGWLPPTEIVETENALVLTLELPGLAQKDVEISVDAGVLTVRGEKLEEAKDEEKKFYLFERAYGAFQRSFTLPRSVDVDKISAEFAMGVLKVHMPKAAEAKPKGKKIEIAAK